MMANLVIDVSEHQGSIDWNAVKGGIDGVIIRCGYGDDEADQDDRMWQRNVSQCESLGIPYGVYLYSYADSDAHARSEVAHVLRLLDGHDPQYPVYIDLEENVYGWYAKRCANIFCDAIEDAGYTPGVYTFESYYNSYMSGYGGPTLWIAKFGANDGVAHDEPSIGASYDAWQFSSAFHTGGYGGNLDVSYFYFDPSESGPAIRRGQIAADIHRRMCEDDRFGYSWVERWGANEEQWTVDDHTFTMSVGDYDCSSSTIQAWRKAIEGSKYEGKLDGATYTGNMRSVFTKSGLFEWKPMSFLAEPGDLYLRESSHVAMCQTQYPDVLSEFCISETGGTTGKRGDQTGGEAAVHAYYDYPWDGILHYNGNADSGGHAPSPKPRGDESAIHFRVCCNGSGTGWLDEMWGHYDTGGSSDEFAGIPGLAIRWIAIKGVKRYRVRTTASGWLPWVSGYDINDLDQGCAGDGAPIVALQVDDDKARYAVGVIGGPVYSDMVGLHDLGGSGDDYAGDIVHAIDRLFMNWA